MPAASAELLSSTTKVVHVQRTLSYAGVAFYHSYTVPAWGQQHAMACLRWRLFPTSVAQILR